MKHIVCEGVHIEKSRGSGVVVVKSTNCLQDHIGSNYEGFVS